jgi:tetratricopeptide (TPR) repeat protein
MPCFVLFFFSYSSYLVGTAIGIRTCGIYCQKKKIKETLNQVYRIYFTLPSKKKKTAVFLFIVHYLPTLANYPLVLANYTLALANYSLTLANYSLVLANTWRLIANYSLTLANYWLALANIWRLIANYSLALANYGLVLANTMRLIAKYSLALSYTPSVLALYVAGGVAVKPPPLSICSVCKAALRISK